MKVTDYGLSTSMYNRSHVTHKGGKSAYKTLSVDEEFKNISTKEGRSIKEYAKWLNFSSQKYM